MRATDLRVGNLVTLGDKVRPEVSDLIEDLIGVDQEHFSIAALEPDEVRLWIGGEEIEFSYSEIEPVLLKPEHFRQFGFNAAYPVSKNKGVGLPSFYKLNGIRLNVVYHFDSDKVQYYEFGNYKTVVVQYLHQLQNLFHTLNSIELTNKDILK